MSVEQLTDRHFVLTGREKKSLSLQLRGNYVVLFKMQNCPGCREVEPILRQLATENQSVRFATIDVGIYIQTLMLAMKTYGISSCAQATLRDYPDIIRKELGISKNINILLGISFGYFDKKIKANKTLVGRSNSSENIKFIN